MGLRTRLLCWCGGLTAALVAVVLASAATGPVHVGYGTVARVLLGTLAVPTSLAFSPDLSVGTSPLFAVDVPRTARVIVVNVRLPRIVVAAIVGFALGSAGTVMQGFFRNPMADPSIIGVSSGAALGAVATIVVPVAIPFGLPVAAFVGALAAAFGVYLLATENGRTPVATLLLAGVAVQTFLGAAISFLLLRSGESLREAIFWLMGHLQYSGWGDAKVALLVVPPCFLVLLAYARDLNVLLLGEEDAHTLGIEVERTKRILLGVSSVVTAMAVAISGVIGFVGLIVPHVMRLLVGPDHRILLPTSALAGSVFLVAADTVARTALGSAELPVGVVTAFVGAPFFLYLLRTREVRSP